MKTTAPPTSDPNVIAVLHKAGKLWHGLIASSAAAKPELIESRDFAADRVDRLDEWFDGHQVGSVLCVLPAAAVICRNCQLPDAPPEQLEQALRLQAEAHLLGIAPEHRLAMAVLPNAPGETSRNGVILAWPESASFDQPPTTRPVTYVADVAALAAILNGNRPTAALLWLDRANGAVALALTHAAGALFRGTHENAQTADQWQRSIGRIVAETGLSVGHTGAFVDSLVQDARKNAGSLGPNDARLFIPEELIAPTAARINGLSSDPDWWKSYGIAAGALVARTGKLASLTRMQSAAPVETPSRIGTVIELLSRPRIAAIVAVTCILVLMFGPLAVSAVRFGVLKLRFSNIETQLVAATNSRHQLSLYQELQKQKVWPMTKLLADITTNTPLGIELEVVRIEGGKDFSVSGTVNSFSDPETGKSSPPQEVFAQMQENLRKDGLFTEITPHLGNANNLGMYKFDLSGKVVKPYAEPKDGYPVERDFARWTHAMRRDREKPLAAKDDKIAGATGTTPGTTASSGAGKEPIKIANGTATNPPNVAPPGDNIASSDEDPPSEDGEGSGRVRGGSRLSGAGGRSEDDPSVASPDDDQTGGAGAPSQKIPEPITEEQIKAMSLPEAKAALQEVANARKYHKTGELGDRLFTEFKLLMKQIKELQTKKEPA